MSRFWPPKFTLRQLLLFVLAVGIASTLYVEAGAAAVMTVAAWILIAIGAGAMVRFPRVALCSGWLAFCISFMLPVSDYLEATGAPVGTPLLGWQACLAAFYMATQPVALLVKPRLIFLLIPLFATALALFAPLFAVHAGPLRYVVAALLVLGTLVSWCFPEYRGNLFTGFYIWNIALIEMAIALTCLALADDL